MSTTAAEGPAGRTLFAFDVVCLAYAAAMSVAVEVVRPEGRGWFHLAHLAATVAIVLLAQLDGRTGRRLWRFIHHWYPLLYVPLAFRELNGVTAPLLERTVDAQLAAFDMRWFGDVKSWCDALANPWLADWMTVGYWSYFAMPVVLGVYLYRRDRAAFRRCVTVLLVGWLTSYIGYLLVPARGPHFFQHPRPPALEGVWLAGPAFRLLLRWERPITDAFPSGHAIVCLLVLYLAWRYARVWFWVFLPFAVTCLAATVYLRYHYVIDVMVALPWAAAAAALGTAWARWWEPNPDRFQGETVVSR